MKETSRWEKARRFLGRRNLPLYTACLAALLCAPSLWLGLQIDDYILRAALVAPPVSPDLSRSPASLFLFIGSEEHVRHAVDMGGMPWWAAKSLRLAFFRPLTGATHWIDFRLWPERVWLMHLHSLLWFAAAVAAAAILFRRILQPEWVAGLAGLLFALDDAHGTPAAWLANRNACIAAVFSLVALIAHDRWRRDGWRPGAYVASLALLLGLLGGEIAVAAAFYFLAYAIFIDGGRVSARLASLVPAGIVCATWAIAYRAMGFGASGSAMYIDPLADPVRYASAALERAPLLLFGQWALPSELHLLLSQRSVQALWLVACAVVVVLAVLLAPLLRASRVARFFVLGMLLSLIPACSTFPDDRLLFIAGIGGAGLLAQLLAGLWKGFSRAPRSRAWRALARAIGFVLVIIHMFLAPFGLMRGAAKTKTFGDVVERAAESLPSDPTVREQQALIVHTPTAFVSVFGPLIQVTRGRAIPLRTLVLGSSIHSVTIERPADDALLIRPKNGFLMPPGGPVSRDHRQPAFDMRYMFQVFDRLYRDDPAMRIGDRIELTGLIVEITATTPDGRPAEARFEFDRNLDDPRLRWLRWDDGVYVPFEVPDIGQEVTLPPITVPFFR